MRPFPVVVDLDELDHRVLRGASGGEAPAVVHFIFQRREERLCDGVVVAVAGAAAREAHMVAPGPLGELAAGVLRPLVRVEYGTYPRARALSRALTTMSAVMRSDSDQPTTMRVFRSITVDR